MTRRHQCAWASFGIDAVLEGRLQWGSADTSVIHPPMILVSLVPHFYSRLFAGLVFAAVVGAVPVRGGEASAYTLFREGSKIGEYHFTVEEHGQERTVAARMTIAVRVLFVTVYRVAHQRTDVWRGDALVSSSGTSKYNSTLYAIQFTRGEECGELTVNGEKRTVTEPVITVVPWRMTVAGTAILLSEKGSIDQVKLVFDRREVIWLGGRSFEADKYRLTGRKVRELWYNSKGVLLRARYESHGDMIEMDRMPPVENK